MTSQLPRGRPRIFLFRNPSEQIRQNGCAKAVSTAAIAASESRVLEDSVASSPPVTTISGGPTRQANEIDEYNIEFGQHGLDAFSIPVLEHRICNMNALRTAILAGSGRYRGLIITSKRAVEALEEALDSLKEEMAGVSKLAPFGILCPTLLSYR